MLERQNSIVWLPSWLDACALWRMYMPSLTMPGSSLFVFNHAPDFNRIVGNDICVVQRCCTQPQLRFIEMAAGFGLKVVYDLDDNVWDLPDYNPAKPALTAYRNGFNTCMRMVDVVSVSTRTLAKVVERQVKGLVNAHTGRRIPVIVAENKILPSIFAPPLVSTEEVVVGWAGSSSHIGDLPLVQKALEQFTNKPGVRIEVRGINLPEDNPIRAASNYSFKYWVPVAEYAARMPVWGWSIALAPITTHEFNNSKSAIKMVEAGYCGIPCLASWVRPYEEFCQHQPDLKWLLCAGPSAFESKLRTLVNDDALRAYYGGLMAKVVDEHYTLRGKHEGWEEVFSAARDIPYVTNPSMTDELIDIMSREAGPLPEIGQKA